MDNDDYLLKVARMSYKEHPDLYELYIRRKRNAKKSKELIAIGEEALERIDPKYCIRSKIALECAEIELAEQRKITPRAERFWWKVPLRYTLGSLFENVDGMSEFPNKDEFAHQSPSAGRKG